MKKIRFSEMCSKSVNVGLSLGELWRVTSISDHWSIIMRYRGLHSSYINVFDGKNKILDRRGLYSAEGS